MFCQETSARKQKAFYHYDKIVGRIESREGCRENRVTEMCFQLNLWARKTKSSRRWFFNRFYYFETTLNKASLIQALALTSRCCRWINEDIKGQSRFLRISLNSDKWAINWKVYHRGEDTSIFITSPPWNVVNKKLVIHVQHSDKVLPKLWHRKLHNAELRSLWFLLAISISKAGLQALMRELFNWKPDMALWIPTAWLLWTQQAFAIP